jgi:hypothetical protein
LDRNGHAEILTDRLDSRPLRLDYRCLPQKDLEIDAPEW